MTPRSNMLKKSVAESNEASWFEFFVQTTKESKNFFLNIYEMVQKKHFQKTVNTFNSAENTEKDVNE